MKANILAIALIVMCTLLLTAAPAVADGIIIVTPQADDQPAPPIPVPGLKTPIAKPPVVAPLSPYLAIKYHHVTVTITDQVAVTTVDQVFINEWQREMEGVYIFPLPEDAAISSFAMYVDGQRVEGKLLTKEEARCIYEDTVRRRRDPALLEYIGRGAFQARVYHIPPRGERRIQLEYTQVLGRDNNLVRYVYPLATGKFSSRPLQQVSVQVTISSREAIKAVYSSSHDVAISRRGNHQVEVSYEASNVLPDKDFVLYYGLAQGDVGASLLTYPRMTATATSCCLSRRAARSRW